jgi:succinyl-diaminopimelate desuccinylase
MNERLARAIEDRTDDLVALTSDLIRFPTVNPPGDVYTPCAEFIATRLKKRAFETRLIRGEGAPGDSDRYPRTNVVARFEGRSPGATVHFN